MLDYGLVIGLVTASTVAGIGVAKYLGGRLNNQGNGFITREKADNVYQTKDVCDARFQNLTGWMKRIDSKLDELLRTRHDI